MQIFLIICSPSNKYPEQWTVIHTHLSLHFILWQMIFHYIMDIGHNGPNHLVCRTSCRISIGRPLDSTGCPIGFHWTSTRILQVCFKCLRIANFIEKWFHLLSYHPVLSCPILSYPVLSCLILSYPVLSCPLLSCSTMSYPFL